MSSAAVAGGFVDGIFATNISISLSSSCMQASQAPYFMLGSAFRSAFAGPHGASSCPRSPLTVVAAAPRRPNQLSSWSHEEPFQQGLLGRNGILVTWVRFDSGAEIVNDAGHKNQCGMLGSVMDGRTSLPAAQIGLTLWLLTTAWKSPVVEQRMELTQVFATDRNVQ